MQIFAYSRKSTESDERQIQSINDQNSWIIEKIGGENFTLFSESKSAKDPYIRKEFEKMMKDIQKSKKSITLYCWKLDRLSRNPVDSGLLQYLMQIGKIAKIVTDDMIYLPEHSGLIMSMVNAMSNQFILDLKKNVERGMLAKVQKGGCVIFAPLGYLNNKETKEILTDKERIHFIKEIFELRLKKYSFQNISDLMFEKGLRSRKGKKVSKTGIEGILHNPFYIGFQKYKGELYKSIHDTFIDIKIWKEINKTTRGYKKQNTEDFLLKGIIKSYHSKNILLASKKEKKLKSGKINTYVYYHSHNRDENKININQDIIIRAFEPLIPNYCINEKIKPLILKEVKSFYEIYYQELKEKRKALINNIKKIENKSDDMFNLIVDGTISKEKYSQKENELKIEKKSLEKELEDINDLDDVILLESNKVVELLTNLTVKWESSNNKGKLLIIRLIVEELFIDTKKQLYIQENKLFELVKVLSGLNWYSR